MRSPDGVLWTMSCRTKTVSRPSMTTIAGATKSVDNRRMETKTQAYLCAVRASAAATRPATRGASGTATVNCKNLHLIKDCDISSAEEKTELKNK